MEKIVNAILFLKDIYNSIFGVIFISIGLLLLFSLMVYCRLKRMNKTYNKRWDTYVAAVKKEALRMIAEFVVISMLLILIQDSFNIDILDFIRNETWKLIIGFWFIFHIKNGRSIYKYVNRELLLDEIEKGQNPSLQFELMIKQYQNNYDLELEKLGILKSLAPVSLVPLIAGFILENKKISLNAYTIIFFCILFLYIYELWKCYDTLRFWKSRKRKVEERIMNLKEKCAAH